ncbi:RNA polymerase sigma factor [Kitasatospora indigofera]|uniref:RNA polymerase sigma factor n=1 Tax=Kitasatospora indigofera TaxID=67307 RepID=UPI00368F5901
MSEQPFTDAAGTAPQLDLPLAFRGFQELHGQAYFDYAYTVLGDRVLAQDLVAEVFDRFAERWDRVLTEPNPHAFAWAGLRRTVEAELARGAEHRLLIERILFSELVHRQAQPLMTGIDAGTAGLEVGISVAAAVLELSGAKFDVIILRYLNGFSVERTARAMGIDENTVRSLVSQAKAKIRARLAPRYLLRDTAKDDQE